VQPDATIFGMSIYNANRHVIQAISAEYYKVSNVGGGWKFIQISHIEMGVSCILKFLYRVGKVLSGFSIA
jgi:hypothetical protein